MTQLLLNIEDESQTNKLLDFLKTLNYVSVEELTNDKIIVSEDEKNIMRERLKNAKPENFQDWDQLKSRFK
jgi:hypothetical protein